MGKNEFLNKLILRNIIYNICTFTFFKHRLLLVHKQLNYLEFIYNNIFFKT